MNKAWTRLCHIGGLNESVNIGKNLQCGSRKRPQHGMLQGLTS